MRKASYRPKALVPHIWADDVPLINVLDADIKRWGYSRVVHPSNALRRLVRYGYLECFKGDCYTWTDDGARLPARLNAARAAIPRDHRPPVQASGHPSSVPR